MSDAIPLISIIVPVYNVYPYLSRCVESILAQTHTNLEIFLIDDGSTDGSGELCDDFARKDERVRVIHQANAGVSAARNAGLDSARGEWVGFVDSDDWIEPDMYEKLLRAAVESGKEVAACGFKGDVYPEIAGVVSRMESLEYIVSSLYLKGSMCTLLYSRGLIEAGSPLRLDPNIHGGEDRVFVTEVFLRADGLLYLPEGLYRACGREGSATRSFNAKRLTALDARERILTLVSSLSDRLARLARFKYMDMAINLTDFAVREKQYEHLPMLKKATRRYAFEYFMSREVILPRKIRNAAFLFFPRLSSKILEQLKKRFGMNRIKSKLNWEKRVH